MEINKKKIVYIKNTMIEIVLENFFSTLNNLPYHIEKEIDNELTIQEKNYYFALKYNKFWDGKYHLYSKKTKKVFTGCLRRILNILDNYQKEYVIRDLRKRPQLTHPIYFRAHLRPYQEEAIEIACQKQRGVIQIATGGGKSLILVGIACKLNIPTLILVHRKELLYQLFNTFKKNIRPSLVGIVGDGYEEFKHITIGMIQTLVNVKYKEKLTNFQAVLVDECHHVPCETIKKILKRTESAFYRIGVTATNFRDDNMDLMIEALLGPLQYKISPTYLIEQKFLSPTQIILSPFNHSSKEKGTYIKVYEKEIVLNEKRNNLIIQWVEKALKKNLSCLVAVTRLEHGKILLEKIKKIYPEVRFIKGEDKSKYRIETLKLLNKKEIKCVICTTVFGEGVDVPSLDVLINAKAQDSSVDAIQLAGRVMRTWEGKEKAFVVDILDEGHPYFSKHSKNRIKAYTKMGFEIIKYDLF